MLTTTLAAAGRLVAAIAFPVAVASQPLSAQSPPPTRLGLEEAVSAALKSDPRLVTTEGVAAQAEWARRAARASLFLPSISAGANATHYSAQAFNIGTLQPASRVVMSALVARYDLFAGGRKLAIARQTERAASSADLAVREAEFAVRREAINDFLSVVSARELHLAALERERRAAEQLSVARSRVSLGAAVPTDSLQVMLELSRARVDVLDRAAALDVARLQLGRRTGVGSAVEAAVDGPMAVGAPPVALDEAIRRAVSDGPAFRAARAREEASSAAFSAERAAYLPTISVVGTAGSFGDRFFPRAAYRSELGVSISLPIWDNGVRELTLAQARSVRDAARATRLDLERGVAKEVTGAYTAFLSARAAIELATSGASVARELYRVQQARYRAGATTILDVLEAQSALTGAESDVVLGRQRAWVALADLESILGQRLITKEIR
jgi:outer membrane protein